MTSLRLTPELPKSAEERELEHILMNLVARRDAATEYSAERRMVERQIDGIRRGSELGGMLVEEVNNGDMPYWL